MSVVVLIILLIPIASAGTGRTVQGKVLRTDGTAAEGIIVIVHTNLDGNCDCSTIESLVSYTDSNGEYTEASDNLRFNANCVSEGTNFGDSCDGYWDNNDELWISVEYSTSGNPINSQISSDYNWGSYYSGEPIFADVINAVVPSNSVVSESNLGGGSGGCYADCEKDLIECLEEGFYKECIDLNSCREWETKLVSKDSECINDEVISGESIEEISLYCGNGVCEETENHESCCQDCGCQDNYYCEDNFCLNMNNLNKKDNSIMDQKGKYLLAGITVFGFLLAVLLYFIFKKKNFKIGNSPKKRNKITPKRSIKIKKNKKN